MRAVPVAQRRRAVVRRHHLDGSAEGPEAVVAALLALHATDPASVYLSVLARSAGTPLADVADAMYRRRTLVRWMAMRRTLFVFPVADVPTVQAAVSTPLAVVLRRRLVARIERHGTDPAVDGDVATWVAGLEERVRAALVARGEATGAQLSADVPGLRTTIRDAAPSEVPQALTSPLLAAMSAAGDLVRAVPQGAWTTRGHRWEPLASWWPEGMVTPPPADAERALARRWLERFGPATAEDLQWWTGWTKTTTRRALAAIDPEEVDLHGEPGIALPGQVDEIGTRGGDAAPAATLLPALDPTPMGWKRRDWFLTIDPRHVVDRFGNIGPTVWWDGELVGSWATAPSGEVRTALVADRGAEAGAAVDAAAGALQARLGGAVVTPAFRTPLERALAAGGAGPGSAPPAP